MMETQIREKGYDKIRAIPGVMYIATGTPTATPTSTKTTALTTKQITTTANSKQQPTTTTAVKKSKSTVTKSSQETKKTEVGLVPVLSVNCSSACHVTIFVSAQQQTTMSTFC